MKGFIAVELTRSQLGDNYEYSTNPVKVYLASEVEAALAEKDAEIAKLREQVGTLREARALWRSIALHSGSRQSEPAWWRDSEEADAKERACGALTE